MSVGVAGGGSGCQWTVGRWIWGGQDQQQQQYSVIGGWLGQECEMNMQVEGRIGEDVNESSSGAFPYPTPHTRNSSVPLPRTWNLPGMLPRSSPASSPGFPQEFEDLG